MKKLILNRLLILSHSLSKSIDIPFSNGLNIIVGANKTGKSSLIKTAFDCFGCKTKFEGDWIEIVSAAALIFSYGTTQYCIVKRADIRDLFILNEDWNCIVSTSDFSEFNSELMKQMEIRIPCVPAKGKSDVITTPVLFALQYIDQDSGWTGIAKSFSNSSNTKDWNNIVRNLVSGFHDEEYFELKADITRLLAEKNDKIGVHEMNLAFYERMRLASGVSDTESTVDPEEQARMAEKSMKEADECQREIITFETRAHELERMIFKAKASKKMYARQIEEAKKDVFFALKSDNVLVCPCCGAEYENELVQHLQLSEDISICENAVLQIDTELSAWNEQIRYIHIGVRDLRTRYNRAISDIKNANERESSHEEYIKRQGRREILDKGYADILDMEKMISSLESDIGNKNRALKKLSSLERKRKINDKISSVCIDIAEMIQYPTQRVRIKNFMQVVKETGSDLPKCVYMYYVAMYLVFPATPAASNKIKQTSPFYGKIGARKNEENAKNPCTCRENGEGQACTNAARVSCQCWIRPQCLAQSRWIQKTNG